MKDVVKSAKKPKIDIYKSIQKRLTGEKGEMPTKAQLGDKPLWPDYDPGSLRENWERFINEDPVERVGDPTYIQKIYELIARVGVHKKKGGDRQQTFTEIRGIPGVTVVSVDSRGTSRDENYYYSTINIKFEMVRGESPLVYKNDTLIPGLRKIKGMRLMKLGNVKEVTPYEN